MRDIKNLANKNLSKNFLFHLLENLKKLSNLFSVQFYNLVTVSYRLSVVNDRTINLKRTGNFQMRIFICYTDEKVYTREK